MPVIERRPKVAVESSIQDRILLAVAPMPDVRLYRNLVGTYETVRAGWIKTGLGPGTADLVGWLSVPCAAAVPVYSSAGGFEIMGYARDGVEGTRHVARFLAVEVKKEGRAKDHKARVEDQAAWLQFVRDSGGIADFVTSVEEALNLINRGRRWEL